jgi:hypothetical protein
MDVNRDICGTLHSICFRALDRPTIAETKAHEFSHVFPQFALHADGDVGGTSVDVDDPYGGGDMPASGDLPGQQLMARMQVLRARMIDRSLWPEQVGAFNEAWESWKRANGYLDFTDLIERCLTDVDVAPYNPSYAIIDECFPYDTLVTLADGSCKKIGEIVERKLDVEVAAYDEKTGSVVSRKVTGWHTSQLNGRELLSLGGMTATEDHPVYTQERGYVSLREVLGCGQDLTVLYLPSENLRSNRAVYRDGTIHCHRVAVRRLLNKQESWRQRDGKDELYARTSATGLSTLETPAFTTLGWSNHWATVHVVRRKNLSFRHQVAPTVSVGVRTGTPGQFTYQADDRRVLRSSRRHGARRVDYGRRITCSPNTDRAVAVYATARRCGTSHEPYLTHHGYPMLVRYRQARAPHAAFSAGRREDSCAAYRAVRPWVHALQDRSFFGETGSRRSGADRSVNDVSDMRRCDRTSVKVANDLRKPSVLQGTHQQERAGETVYCLDVEGCHNFFANGILVHNCQDLVPLQVSLINKWARNMQFVQYTGDIDQCQPAGTMVLTPDGYVPIEHLDPNKHRVVEYDRASTYIVGKRTGGYAFEKTSHEYIGRMHTLRIGQLQTRATTNHRWLVRWDSAIKKNDMCCVYIMRKGNRYRVGWCQLFNRTRLCSVFHLGQRANLEKADEAWILGIYDTRSEASCVESAVAARYGLPLVTFRALGQHHSTRENIDHIFDDLLGDVDLRARAAQALYDFGRDIRFPIWKHIEQRGRGTVFITESCNLFPEAMMVPVPVGGNAINWMNFSLEHEHFSGTVYSLETEKYHTYIADGIVTHNCLYNFLGATPQVFVDMNLPPERQHVLTDSRRVPRAVHAYATEWIKQAAVRSNAEYYPRDYEGEVRPTQAQWGRPESIIQAIQPYLDEGKTVMVLTSCAYMLEPLKQALRAAGMPFGNKWRCSPPDEPILTTDGYVSIGELDENVHRIAGYYSHCNDLSWGGRSGPNHSKIDRGFAFSKGSRHFSGDMFTITTDRSRTRVTGNHRVRVKFHESFYGKYVVYLMKRGNWWRVGCCATGSGHNSSNGIGWRVACEQADGAWIIGVFDTKQDALIREAEIQCTYGIPGMIFDKDERDYRYYLSREHRADFFNRVADVVDGHAKKLLCDLHLDVEYPLFTWEPGIRRGAKYRMAFETVAANVIPGYMEVPTVPDCFANDIGCARTSPDWMRCSVAVEHYDGMVYSLDVPGPAHYVSGGAVVHNSKRGDWNPLRASRGVSSAQRILSLLRPDPRVWDEDARMWTHEELRQWAEVLNARGGIFVRAGKALLDQYKGNGEIVTMEQLYDVFTAEVVDELMFGADMLEWFTAHLMESKRKVFDFPLLVAQAHGAKALREEPRLCIGTCHSVKGAESAVVMLLPDLSRSGMQEYMQTGELRDSVIRTFYVGATRSSESLLLGMPSSPFAVKWL